MSHVFRTRLRRALPAALGLAVLAGAGGPADAQAPCTCRAAGASFDLEACTCLATPKGPRVACCGKVLNNTAWRFTDERCPLAAAPAAAPARAVLAKDRPNILPHSAWRAALLD